MAAARSLQYRQAYLLSRSPIIIIAPRVINGYDSIVRKHFLIETFLLLLLFVAQALLLTRSHGRAWSHRRHRLLGCSISRGGGGA